MSVLLSSHDASPEVIPAASRRSRLPHAFLIPTIAVLVLALGYPLGRQVVMSLQEYGLAQQFGQPARWVGLANYQALVTDSYLWAVVVRSVAFCLLNAAVTMGLGVAIAVLLTRVSRWVRILTQSGLLLAWAMPVLAALTIWQWMFDSQYGIVNWLLARLGFDSYANHAWLIDPLSFYLVATVVIVWMSVPFVVFTVYAALTQVPVSTVEAAEIDGATAWQRFRYVVVPAIRPVLLVVGLLQVIWDLRVFTQIYVLQEAGGISTQTNLIGTYVYRLGIAEGQFGMASAVAIFMLALTVILTFGYVRRMLRTEDA